MWVRKIKLTPEVSLKICCHQLCWVGGRKLPDDIKMSAD